jgi:thiol-disulfide isomerase/thioredoxin
LKRFLRPLLWVLLVVVLVLGVMAALVALMEQQSGARPDVALKTLAGETVTLDQIAEGKPMVVNIWATWCPPCIREMPLLAKAQKAYPDIRFVFVNQGEHSETVTDFLKNGDLTLENVLLDSGGQVAKVTASMALPTTLFYNAAGEQVDLQRGELNADILEALLSRIQSD